MIEDEGRISIIHVLSFQCFAQLCHHALVLGGLDYTDGVCWRAGKSLLGTLEVSGVLRKFDLDEVNAILRKHSRTVLFHNLLKADT